MLSDYPPCHNPSCKTAQQGRGHPNCRCYAEGGCVGFHQPSCEHYADGGDVQPPQPFPAMEDDPKKTMGHYAVTQGLLGLIRDVGKPKMMEPERHEHVLREAKAQHEWRRNPGELKLPKSHGTKLGEHIANGAHDEAAAHMHGHPLVGQAQMKHLKPIMDRLAGPAMSETPNPEAFRGSVDYLHGAAQGEHHLSSFMDNLLGSRVREKIHSSSSRNALKAHLDDLQANPQKMLDVSGSLGHYMPGHSAELAAQSAQAVNYLESLKPKPVQGAPLDLVSTVSKAQEAGYDRQLDIAQQPLLALQHTSSGTLQPQDVTTIQTVYPGLYQDMVSKLGERIIDAKTKGVAIPYYQRQTIGMFIGQPVDSTMTPTAIQTIVKNNGSMSPQQKQQRAQENKKASGAELKQIDKVDSLYQTPDQERRERRD